MSVVAVDGRADLILLFEGDQPPADQVADMVSRLDAAPDLDAVGVVEPVTDAIKEVDDQGRVVGSLDRSRLVTLGRPAVVRRTAWEAGQIGSIGVI